MTRKKLGRLLGVLIVLGATAAAAAVWHENHLNPQTDDAEVFANLIGIAPEVNGRIVRIAVKDNQFVRQGDTLFEVDPIPYEHALETARSQQAALEGQIRDLQRSVTAQESAVVSAASNTRSAQAKIASSEAAVQAAQASIEAAKAALSQASADYAYAENQVLRLEPLLIKQFVTVDLVDQARTSRSVKGEGVR
jgi:membrane fusion protein, multidrug efflux system